MQPGTLSVPELCHHMAKLWVTGSSCATDIVQFKRHSPGKVLSHLSIQNHCPNSACYNDHTNYDIYVCSFAFWFVVCSQYWPWWGATSLDWCFHMWLVSSRNPSRANHHIHCQNSCKTLTLPYSLSAGCVVLPVGVVLSAVGACMCEARTCHAVAGLQLQRIHDVQAYR